MNEISPSLITWECRDLAPQLKAAFSEVTNLETTGALKTMPLRHQIMTRLERWIRLRALIKSEL